MVKKIIFILNVIISFSLLLSYLSAHLNPSMFYPLAFFGMAYPFLLVANVLFALFWLIAWKKQVFLPVFSILIGYNHIGKFIEFNTAENAPQGIKVMSYNVRVFDLYNWTGNTKTRDKIFDLIRETSAEILCFQEFFYSEKKDYFNTLDTLLQFQNAKSFHAEYTKTILDEHHFGIATFSKFPIVNRGRVELATRGNNLCIYTDIVINNDTLRVYNAHLASLHLARTDYKFLEELAQLESGEQAKGIRQIMKRIKQAFIRRSSQADAIAHHIAASPYPVVFCGDFNDTPLSYAYSTIASGMKDAFVESGVGIGTTYAGKFSPFRIDYILHSDSISSTGFETLPDELSDHYPITCYIHFKDEQN